MATSRRAALYVRVSTSDRGQTVENQLQPLQEAAGRLGWTVVAIYRDEGISGTKGRDKRPGLDALLKGVARREFDIVAAWSVCRLGRSLSDLIGLLGELRSRDIDLYLHQQALDTSTPSGRMLFGMLGVFSEFERAMIRDRVMAGLDRARSSGKRLGRPRTTPFQVQRIRLALDEGRGVRETARLLKVSAAKVSARSGGCRRHGCIGCRLIGGRTRSNGTDFVAPVTTDVAEPEIGTEFPNPWHCTTASAATSGIVEAQFASVAEGSPCGSSRPAAPPRLKHRQSARLRKPASAMRGSVIGHAKANSAGSDVARWTSFPPVGGDVIIRADHDVEADGLGSSATPVAGSAARWISRVGRVEAFATALAEYTYLLVMLWVLWPSKLAMVGSLYPRSVARLAKLWRSMCGMMSAGSPPSFAILSHILR